MDIKMLDNDLCSAYDVHGGTVTDSERYRRNRRNEMELRRR